MTEANEALHGHEGRAPLTRARILRKALEIVDGEGLEALSMRRLAGGLGVSPMSLYNHVADKDALLEGVVEQLLGEIDLSGLDAENWANAIKQAAYAFRRTLLAHPHAIPLLGTKQVTTPDAYRPIDAALGLLQKGGFSVEEAVQAEWTLVGYILGHVTFVISNPMLGPEDDRRLYALERRRMLPEDEFPHVVAALPFMIECDIDATFEYGIDTIIAGLEARLAARPGAR